MAGDRLVDKLTVSADESFPHELGVEWQAYLDAFQTVLSFIAQIAMAHRKIDSWILWIMVDIASIGLYIATDLLFIALLYCLFLVLAVRGLFEWLGVRAQTTAVASGIRRVESGAAP